MATTSGALAKQAVDCLVRSGVLFAVVHGEEALTAGVVDSDVDVVVDRPLSEIVATVAPGWIAMGLWPIMVWPYDVGGTGSIFLATEDAADGVQLDVLHDPPGRGQYGVRSSALLDAREPGARFPRVNARFASAYLLSKRLRKGQVDRASAIASDQRGDDLETTLDSVLRQDVAQQVHSFLAGASFEPPPARTGAARALARLVRPVGAWVRVADGTDLPMTRRVAQRFLRFLPRVQVVERSGLRAWVRDIAPVRWRAGLVFTPRAVTGPMRPDLELRPGNSEQDLAEQVVMGLSRRHARL